MATARGIRARAFLVVAVSTLAMALVPLAASGEPKAQPGDKPPSYDPENIVAISQYMATIAKANERFVAKDHTTAIDTYKKAIVLSPRNPLGHVFLAEAYLATSNVGEAEAAIEQAYGADSKNLTLRAHVLFLRADIAERQKKWEQAKSAWQAYAEHVAKLGDAGGFPQTAAERLKALQKMMELEKAYAGVRERIAAEKLEKADAGKGKNGASKK